MNGLALEEKGRGVTGQNGHAPLDERLSRLGRIYEEIWEKNIEAYCILQSIVAGGGSAVREEFAGSIDISYRNGPPRILSMEIPARLMTLKELVILNQRKWERRFEQYVLARDIWEGMVACAMEKGHRAGFFRAFEAFGQALVIITVFEKPRQKHDVDNFSIGFLHNALVRTGVLTDDNFLRLKYLVRGVYLVHNKSQEKTRVTVIDESMGNIYCHKCNLCELVL